MLSFPSGSSIVTGLALGAGQSGGQGLLKKRN